MNSRIALTSLALVAVSGSPAFASAIPSPSSLTLRAGYVAAQPAAGQIRAIAPSLSVTWDAGPHLAVWSSIGYVQEQATGAFPRHQLAYTNAGYPTLISRRVPETRTHIVPLTLGLRVYPKRGARPSAGPFLELGPAIFLARYGDFVNASHTGVMGGLQTGLGLRFPGIGASRGEIGVSYSLAEGFGDTRAAQGRLGTGGEVDYNLFSAYVAIGFGD